MQNPRLELTAEKPGDSAANVRQHKMRIWFFTLGTVFLAALGCHKSNTNEREMKMKQPHSSIDSWPRPHFRDGGGDALLFYVVFGTVDMTAPLSARIYRCGGIPDDLNIIAYSPTVHPETVDSFRNGYLWERLQKTDLELAARISTQNCCVVLRGTFKDPRTLDYLRDTVGLITHFLDHGGVAVYDPQMFQWWSAKTWKERIFDPAGPVPRHHTVILVSEENSGTEWVHTRGLRKFGRPDLSIHRVPPLLKDAIIDLCNRFIEMQAFGEVVVEGQEIRMKSLPSGMRCHNKGDLNDPDFNNVHLELGPVPDGESLGPVNPARQGER